MAKKIKHCEWCGDTGLIHGEDLTVPSCIRRLDSVHPCPHGCKRQVKREKRV